MVAGCWDMVGGGWWMEGGWRVLDGGWLVGGGWRRICGWEVFGGRCLVGGGCWRILVLSSGMWEFYPAVSGILSSEKWDTSQWDVFTSKRIRHRTRSEDYQWMRSGGECLGSYSLYE